MSQELFVNEFILKRLHRGNVSDGRYMMWLKRGTGTLKTGNLKTLYVELVEITWINLLNYSNNQFEIRKHRSSPTKVFFWSSVLGGFAGERPCRGAISIKLHSNFVRIALPHGCSPLSFLRLSGTLLDDCFWMQLYSCITFSVNFLIKSRCK